MRNPSSMRKTSILTTQGNLWFSILFFTLLAGCSRNDSLSDPKSAELEKQRLEQESADPEAQLQGKSTDELVGLMKNGAPNIRSAAFQVLMKRNDPASVKGLIPLTKAQDPAVRALAVVVLSKFPNSLPFEDLVQLLKDEEPDVRNPALAFLTKTTDPRAFEHLEAALRQKDAFDPYGRADAIHWIANSGHPRAPDCLLRLLNDENESAIEIIRGLGLLKEKRAVKPLIQTFQATEISGLCDALAVALGEIGDPAAIGPLTEYAAMGPVYAEALAKLGWKPKTPEDEIRLLISTDQKEKLLAKWEVTLRVLQKELSHPRSSIRRNAIISLLGFERKEAHLAILNHLKSPTHGRLDMPTLETLLNCQNPEIKAAAKDYARKNDYQIYETIQ